MRVLAGTDDPARLPGALPDRQHLEPAQVQWRHDRRRRHPDEEPAGPSHQGTPQMQRFRQARRVIHHSAGGGQARHHLEIRIDEPGIGHRLGKRHRQNDGQQRIGPQ